jgi:hypothetical protein
MRRYIEGIGLICFGIFMIAFIIKNPVKRNVGATTNTKAYIAGIIAIILGVMLVLGELPPL